jgi:transcriptional regulator with XRE-family HTH domain
MLNRETVFKLCLLQAGFSLRSFAKQIGVSACLVSRVARNKATSAKVSDAINSFISKHSSRVKSAVDKKAA